MEKSQLELECCNLAEQLGWVFYRGSGRNVRNIAFTKNNYAFFVEFKEDRARKNMVNMHFVDNIEFFRTILIEEEVNAEAILHIHEEVMVTKR